jgi:dihydrofolate reductase
MNLIVAVDNNWGIGLNGTQTVVLPEDRRHFRELTDGATVIVGRKTLQDFPGSQPLPGRNNIVLSANADLKIDGANVAHSLDELFVMIENFPPDKVFVIGGDSVFRMLLPYCTYAYVTKIDASPEADVFFPDLDSLDNWVLDQEGEPKEYGGVRYVFVRYKNNAPLTYTVRGSTDV